MLWINTNNIARRSEPRAFIFKYPQKMKGGESALTILYNTRPSLTVMLRIHSNNPKHLVVSLITVLIN